MGKKLRKNFDAIVVGTGAGGGIALRTLCDQGLDVCALNAGPPIDPHTQYRQHKQPYDMPFRGFGNPQSMKYSCGFMDNEYTEGIFEREIPYTTGPGTQWTWPRCFAVGGKTNFWGRSSARFGDIDFRAASIDGVDVDWPLSYEEISPYYSRIEKLIGVASSKQNRPSNPDGEYLPPMKFRCLDRILEKGCEKLGIPYLPDRIAQLTLDHQGFPKCHFCGNCTQGCEVGSFFSSTWRCVPHALKTGKLDLRTNALAKNVIVDENGMAKGISYIDRLTKEEIEVHAKVVVLAASCSETTRIMLNSKSRHWPTGIANSSGQLGKNLMDHMYGTTAWGYLPQLKGQPPFPDNVSQSTIAWIPGWHNLEKPRQEKFIRRYAFYIGGGCGEFPAFHEGFEGFGSAYKKQIKDFYPAPVSLYIQAPSLPSPTNYIDIDPVVKDPYGIPVARFHFKWGENELKMWDNALKVSKQIFKAAGAEYLGKGDIATPGYSLHESGTARMGADKEKFVTNKWCQTHDVPNLFLADASLFTNMNDKSTTLSIMAFSLRATDRVMDYLKKKPIG